MGEMERVNLEKYAQQNLDLVIIDVHFFATLLFLDNFIFALIN